MDISPETISKYKIKKVLKISIFTLLFFVIGLLIFEYFRITPSNVRFTNVTSSSVTVSWSSKSPVSATVIPFEGNTTFPIRLFCFFKERFFDSRDIERAELESIESIEQRVIDSKDGKLSTEDFEVEVTRKGRYTTHHVKVKNLEPNTQYSFLVGDSILFKKVKQSTWEDTITTTAIEEELKTPSPTYGTVLNANSNSDVALTELPPVSDGIVYLNLYDKESEKRSNIFSSSLNKEGKWYIDISKAIDSEGNNFVETYSFEGVNMYYELELDAGELGRWKTMDLASALSPSQPFVINTPDTIQDIEIPGSVVKISNNVLGTFVPSAYAEEGVCAFSTYCEYQVKLSDGLYYKITDGHTCSNQTWIEEKLVARNCANAANTPAPQENPSLTCSGKPVETVGYNNNACYICQKEIQNGYYVAKWVQTFKYAVEGTNCVKKELKTLSNNEFCDEGQCNCPSHPTKKIININHYCTDGEKTILADNQKCTLDRDGCLCDGVTIQIGSNETCTLETVEVNPSPSQPVVIPEIGNNEFCNEETCHCVINLSQVDKTIDRETYCTDGRKTDSRESNPCKDRDGCLCEEKDIDYLEFCEINNPDIVLCDSTFQDGDSCTTENSLFIGTWSDCKCIPPKIQEGTPCYETDNFRFKNLVYWDDTYFHTKYSCINGKMTPVGDKDDIGCHENKDCTWTGIRERCLSYDMSTILYCTQMSIGNKWRSVPEESDWFLVSANIIDPTPRGEKCEDELCICKTGIDHKLDKDQWCIDLSFCADSEGFVCNINGNTCKYISPGVEECTGPIKSSSLQPSFQLLSNSIVPKAFAQASETEEYIIDSSTGLISGITSGIYTFELDGITYMFFVDEEALGANNGKILIFIDKDGNGIYDEGTDTKVSELASKIAISTIQKEYSYKLKQGFNFVSFPFLNVTESARTALGLLEMLNTLTNGSVYSIAKFDSSWEIVGKNGDTYLSNDFQLIPGQGYVIKVIKDVEVSIQGYPIKFENEEDSAPITLFTGWNLIGIYGSKARVYTAKTLLQDINSFEEIDFTADIVNGWDQDAQSYEGFVLENTNGIESEYGFDFPINTLKSYFVRVADGKGNWQPSLAE